MAALVTTAGLGCSSSDDAEMPADEGAAGEGAVDPGPEQPGDDPTSDSATAAMPCDVAGVVVANCHGCHGETPLGGAISLVTNEDWHQQSPLYDPTKKVYEVAAQRIEKREMPQGATLSQPDFEMLDTWLTAGAPAGTADDVECIAALPPAAAPTGSSTLMRDDDDQCKREGADDPIVEREGERCYSFLTHGQSGVDDTSKFTVPPGESYHEIYYEVPWGPNDLMTRFGHDLDNTAVLHHYLIFTNNNTSKQPGQVDKNVLGTTLFSNSTLVGGWAVGGCGQELPPDAGARLPESSLLMIQWHMFNTTGAEAEDASSVQICVVPDTEREHVVGVTFLGTENLGGLAGMPPGANDFTTRCPNNSEEQVTVLGFTPHMHLIGTNMRTELEHLDGSVETIFDKPFTFDYQVGYALPDRVPMEAGETLITTCSFFNDTGVNVGFGESTKSEMCYNYVAYYPAGALDKSIFSLIGATNVCW